MLYLLHSMLLLSLFFCSCFTSDPKVHVPLFLIPLYAIIFFNIVAFVLVIRVLVVQSMQKQKRTQGPNRESDVKAGIRVAISMVSVTMLFGLFWLLGVFSVSKAAAYFEWPFIVLNTSQGIIIFLFLGVLNSHKEWKSLFVRKKKRRYSSNPQHIKGMPNSKVSGTKETGFSNVILSDSSLMRGNITEFTTIKEQRESIIKFSDDQLLSSADEKEKIDKEEDGDIIVNLNLNEDDEDDEHKMEPFRFGLQQTQNQLLSSVEEKEKIDKEEDGDIIVNLNDEHKMELQSFTFGLETLHED